MIQFDTKEIDAIAAAIVGTKLKRATTKERALSRLRLVCKQHSLPEQLFDTARTAQDAKESVARFFKSAKASRH
jgi:hypothetical protein